MKVISAARTGTLARMVVAERHRDQQADERLEERHGQGVAGQEALAGGGEATPFALAQHLEEALVPAGALLEEGPEGGRGLLAGDQLGVVGDRDLGPSELRRTPSSQSSARQSGSQPPAWRSRSVWTKTVLPRGG